MEFGRHSDGGGLYLVIDGEVGMGSGRRRWLYFFQWSGKRREMGPGGYPAVSLAHARRARDEAEKLVRQGVGPIVRRDDERQPAGFRNSIIEHHRPLLEPSVCSWHQDRAVDAGKAGVPAVRHGDV
ncbi:DUF4102 domain-containing protein [Starkeya sp. ORNL1]|nr:DUF4102 domain-containing protein [Starkeya sp. ORNL1]